MINPKDIINHNRTNEELEELILFLICVAGKKALTVAEQLDKFLKVGGTTYQIYINKSPFEIIKFLDMHGSLLDRIKNHGFGQYTKLEKAFREIADSDLDLRTCSKEDLMQIYGIGRKSASCFLAWTRKGEQVAMLDTHVLAELRDLGHKAPKSTPSSKKEYDRLEKIWLDHCKLLKVNPIEYDLQVWIKRSSKVLTKNKNKVN